MFRITLLSILMLFVVGCSAIKEKEIVTVVEYEVVKYEIPSRLTTPCKPLNPMDSEVYSRLNDDQKQEYLSNYIIGLYGDLKKCDNKINGIKSYMDKVNTISDIKTGN